MIQNILSSYIVIALQTTVVFLIINKIFNFNFNNILINLYILFLLFSIFSVALGISISNISKDRIQFGYLTNLIIVPMCMLGGCYWPQDFMPEYLRNISNLVPTSWFMKAVEKIVFGTELNGVYKEISIIILFTIIFFLIGISKKLI
ncbi:ABC transporter permease [Caloramator sp. mosi_1]|nr:ABC transporter permease [Caloramator sp. mosi_1]WDC83463.1 ABC transporter permease [Caloramator sp. mosi_1]